MAEHLRLKAEMANLEAFLDFGEREAERLGAPPGLDMKLRLVLEELLVNVISYAYADGEPGDAELECRLEDAEGGNRFCVVVRDRGAAFDPLSKQAPDVHAGLEDRPIGGLGILLAVEMSDHIAYAREGDANVLTACFDI